MTIELQTPISLVEQPSYPLVLRAAENSSEYKDLAQDQIVGHLNEALRIAALEKTQQSVIEQLGDPLQLALIGLRLHTKVDRDGNPPTIQDGFALPVAYEAILSAFQGQNAASMLVEWYASLEEDKRESAARMLLGLTQFLAFIGERSITQLYGENNYVNMQPLKSLHSALAIAHVKYPHRGTESALETFESRFPYILAGQSPDIYSRDSFHLWAEPNFNNVINTAYSLISKKLATQQITEQQAIEQVIRYFEISGINNIGWAIDRFIQIYPDQSFATSLQRQAIDYQLIPDQTGGHIITSLMIETDTALGEHPPMDALEINYVKEGIVDISDTSGEVVVITMSSAPFTEAHLLLALRQLEAQREREREGIAQFVLLAPYNTYEGLTDCNKDPIQAGPKEMRFGTAILQLAHLNTNKILLTSLAQPPENSMVDNTVGRIDYMLEQIGKHIALNLGREEFPLTAVVSVGSDKIWKVDPKAELWTASEHQPRKLQGSASIETRFGDIIPVLRNVEILLKYTNADYVLIPEPKAKSSTSSIKAMAEGRRPISLARASDNIQEYYGPKGISERRANPPHIGSQPTSVYDMAKETRIALQKHIQRRLNNQEGTANL